MKISLNGFQAIERTQICDRQIGRQTDGDEQMDIVIFFFTENRVWHVLRNVFSKKQISMKCYTLFSGFWEKIKKFIIDLSTVEFLREC